MPVVVYSVLRVALLAVSWLLLTWAGLHPLLALLVAAFVAWGVSYAALGGPRDAAARYLAARAAVRAAHGGRPLLSPHAQQDADVEDAAVDAALGDEQPAVPAERAAHEPEADAVAGAPSTGDQEPDGDVARHDRGPDHGRGHEQDHGSGSAQSASASPSSTP